MTQVEKLRELEEPIAYATGGCNRVAHVPAVEDGEVAFACCVEPRSVGVQEARFFARRRNPRMCHECADQVPDAELPDMGSNNA